MRVSRGHFNGRPSERRTDTFSGGVWGDPILPPEDEVVVNAVVFEPGGRTYWHSHEVAQVLHVTMGEGWLQLADGAGERLLPGDVAHIAAGEVHWHGATPETLMSHLAVSVGETRWLDPVSDDDYAAALER